MSTGPPVGTAGDVLASGLPGAIGISRLRVYDWPCDDGARGGSPHLHTASSEGYVVLGGSGAVETLSARGRQRTPLEPGTVLWFTPGTVHRLINGDGALEILTLMQNAGLPEAGDAVLTFPMEVLRDRREYRARARLPASEDPVEMEAAARARRDLALRGYRELCERAATDLDATLHDLYSAAAGLVSPEVGAWRELIHAGPETQLAATRRQLASLAAARPGDLIASGLRTVPATPGPERWGMCGRLTVWPTAAL